AAEELRRAAIVVHVVGLGLRPADAAAMACLPQTTGGRFLNARTAEQIAANLEEALRLTGSEGQGVERAATTALANPQSAPLPQSAAAVPAEGPPGLYLRALLVPGSEPIGLPLSWTVFSERPGGVVLFEARAPNPHVPVKPGHYVVEVRDGAVAGRQEVDVDDRPAAVNVVLNAGTLHVRAQALKSAALLGDAIVWVSEAGQATDRRQSAPALAMFRGGEGLLVLPAGRSLVHVEQGLVRTERSVVVPAGSAGRIDIPLNAARLLLSAAGQDPAGAGEVVVFSVVEDDPDAPKGRREVVRSTGRQADFVVPPGTYYVVARAGSVETRERRAVGPGDVVRRTLNLAAGRLALATKAPAGAGWGADELVFYRVERLDGPTPEVITTSRAAPVLALMSGRYRVVGRLGTINARTVREVEVRAGQAQQLVLEPQAAALKLRLLAGGTPVLADLLWDVREEA